MAANADPTSDAAFLARPTPEQRALLFCYLTSNIDSDQTRGAYLCGLLGYDLAAVADAAQADLSARLERSSRRLRLTTQGGRHPARLRPAQAGPGLFAATDDEREAA